MQETSLQHPCWLVLQLYFSLPNAFPGPHFFFEWLQMFKCSLNVQKHFIILIWNMLPLMFIYWFKSMTLVYYEAISILTMKYYNRLLQWDKAGFIRAIINKIFNPFHMQSIWLSKHFLSLLSHFIFQHLDEKRPARILGSSREWCLVPWIFLLCLVTLTGMGEK